jgi:hypothetical protein
MDAAEKEIERLKTLEFGTVAFPSGFGMICDVKLTAITDSITLCPVPIPDNFRHLLIIYSVKVARSFAVGNIPQRLQFNGDTATNYHYFSLFASSGPTIGDDVAGLGSADHIRIGYSSPMDTDDPPGIEDHFSAGYVFIPDYADDDKWKSLVFGNFHRTSVPVGPAPSGFIRYHAGGGAWEDAANIVESIRIFSPVLDFQVGSRWTLYGG